MKVFNALFGELTGVFGKAYILAGLLPSLGLVFCASWYLSGDAAATVLAQIAEINDETVGKLAAAALLSLALGLVFFAARSVALDTLQSLPGRRLRPLSEMLVYRQLRKRMAAKNDEDLQYHHLTIVKWINSPDFKQPKYLPPFEPEPLRAEMEQSSREARDLFALLRTMPTHLPRGRECRTMLRGVRALYAYAKTHYAAAECENEIDLWRFEISKPGADGVLDALQDHVHRTWVDSTRTRENFPVENKWVGPTQLGSRSAALDDYAKDRYGIDTSTLLSRLGGVLSPEDRESLADSRLSVETLVNMSVAMAALTVFVIGDSLLSIVRNWSALEGSTFDYRAAAFFAAGVFATVILYKGAVRAFGGLAEKAMRAVDLNRLELLKRLGFAVPADMSAERELWNQLAEFLAPGKPKHLVPDPPLHWPTE